MNAQQAYDAIAKAVRGYKCDGDERDVLGIAMQVVVARLQLAHELETEKAALAKAEAEKEADAAKLLAEAAAKKAEAAAEKAKAASVNGAE